MLKSPHISMIEKFSIKCKHKEKFEKNNENSSFCDFHLKVRLFRGQNYKKAFANTGKFSSTS